MTTDKTQPDTYTLRPVGIIRSEIQQPALGANRDGIELKDHIEKVREQHQWIKNLVSEVEIFPEYEELLQGTEDFSHILILYWPHLIAEERRQLRKVHPMGRKDIPQKGIFATCSPARPNPVLISTVRLLSRDGRILKVQGLDAVNQSPVIDIKPFVQMAHGADNPTRPEWMQQIHRELQGNDTD